MRSQPLLAPKSNPPSIAEAISILHQKLPSDVCQSLKMSTGVPISNSLNVEDNDSGLDLNEQLLVNKIGSDLKLINQKLNITRSILRLIKMI